MLGELYIVSELTDHLYGQRTIFSKKLVVTVIFTSENESTERDFMDQTRVRYGR